MIQRGEDSNHMDTPAIARVIDAALEATVVGSFSRIGPAVRSRVDDWTPIEELPGAGRTVLVTGANSGLGLATVLGLARTGASLRIVVRSQSKAAATVARITEVNPATEVTVHLADLTDLDRVREVAAEIAAAGPLDAVVHNAGAMFDERAETEDGIERTIALHVVGPQALTHGLLDTLAASAGRVIWVSSGGMYTQRLSVSHLQSPDDYAPATAYARAKRAQVVLAGQWQERFGHTGVTFHAMHPGWALTPGVESSLPVFRTVMGPLLRDTETGADTVVWLALADAPTSEPGRFWLDRRPRSTVRFPGTRHDPEAEHRLWTEVERLAHGMDDPA